VERDILAHTARTSSSSAPGVEACAATVAVIQGEETPEVQRVPVLDPGGGSPNQAAARTPPAVAEVAVLARRGGEVLVEGAESQAIGASASQVVAGEEECLLGIPIEVRVDQVEDELAGRGEEVVLKAVECRAPNQDVGVRAQGGDEGLQPGRRGSAIVVREGDELAVGRGDAAVAGAGGTGVRLVKHTELELCGPAGGIEGERGLAAVVHHHGLESACRQCLHGQGVKAADDGPRAVAGGDDDAGHRGERRLRRRVHGAATFRSRDGLAAAAAP
jgi:hypothetical protein